MSDVPSDGSGTPAAGGSRLGRSAVVMAAGTATSRVLGVVRASVLIAAIGANAAAANAFSVANWLPNMLYMLVAGGVLNAVLVPQVVRAYRSANGQEYVDRLLTLAGALLIGLTALLTAAAPLIVWLAVEVKDQAFAGLATAFALWCIPQVLFYGVYTLLGQVLNARGSFGPYMWAPVVNNVVAIAGLVVFMVLFGTYEPDGNLDGFAQWDAQRIAVLGGSATLGVIAQALVLIVPLRRSGFRYRPRLDWRGSGLGSAGRVAGWTFAALVVGQAGTLVVVRVSAAAAQLYQDDVAGNNAYSLAFTMFMLPHSLVTVSLLTALFTRLSAHAAARDKAAVRADFSYGLRLIVVFTVFATAVLAVLALPLVRVVFQATRPAEAGSLAPVVVAMVTGLGALGAWSLCQRVFYAYEDAKGLFRIQVVMAGIVATGSMLGYLVLPARWWVVAAGASIAASYVVGAVWGGFHVRHRLGGTGSRLIRVHVRTIIAALVAAAVGWPLSHLFGNLSGAGFVKAVLVCVVVGVVMAAIYVGLLRLLKVEEVGLLLEPLLSRVRRSMGAPGGSRPAGAASRPAWRRTGPANAHGGDPLDVVVGRGTLLAGRYRLDEPEVTDLPDVEAWTAVDQILDRPVRALVLRGERVRAAQDAARRAALVSDPRLLRVLDVGDHDGLPYTVTEPLAGRDLAELTSHGPLPADQARAIVGEAAVALEVARRRGVHHLALRPSAVRVTPDGGVVVSGLAMDGELLGRGIGDARSTTRADTVALVSLLYLTLTGRWPAPAGSDPGPAVAAPLVEGSPVAPAELVPGVPNDLDTLCAVTLGPHDDGPHSPAELVRELEPWPAVAADEVFGAADAALKAAGPAPWTGTRVGPVVTSVPRDQGGFVPEDPQDAPTSIMGAADADPARPRAAGDGAAVEETVVQDGVVGQPRTVQRQSVRESIADQAGPAARPGTPPPAAPPAFHRQSAQAAAAAASVDAAASHPRSVSQRADGPSGPVVRQDAPTVVGAGAPPVVPPNRAGGTGWPGAAGRPERPGQRPSSGNEPSHEAFDSLIGRSTEALVRKRFDPTPLVLILVGVAVLIGIVVAWNALTSPAPPIGGGADLGTGQTQDDDAADDGAGQDAGADDAVEPPADAPEEPADGGGVPTIAGAQMIDLPPGGDNNEHPEAVPLAIDGDPATAWYTRTYKSPTYGMKSGIGYAVTLAEPTTVTTVTLQVNGTGGMVEVRATDPSTPDQGTVLASGPMSAETVLTFSEPTEATHIVLWFTQLPQTADGSNRVELAEVRLS
ncbi:murein biosynthesis integral membrane protein MurJ [Actinotalea subterranea]|uniref:murein biosynthesis integral membrane protein MurJ n=1 Tax=Actinotalea subterranea TaxID=2607497 RepID=UPI001CAA829F|nr:murein biosynthesis integral membrane protein MurJ [Actinotalea subterranea]